MSVLYERQINCTVVMMPVIVANKETGDSCARRLSRGRERKLVSKWSMNTKLHPTQGLYFRALVAMLYTCTSTSSVNNKGLISDNFSCHWCMCVCVCERDRKCEWGYKYSPLPFAIIVSAILSYKLGASVSSFTSCNFMRKIWPLTLKTF